MAQRRPDGEARTEQRRNRFQIDILRHGNQEVLIADKVLGVAAKGGGAAVFIGAVIGWREARLAVLLFLLLAKMAMPAGINRSCQRPQYHPF